MLLHLRRCLRLLPPGKRWLWAALVPLSVATAAAEAAGAGAVFFLIAVLSDPASPPELPLVGDRLAAWGGLDGRERVRAATVAVVVFYLLKNAFLGVVLYLQSQLVYRTRADLARRLYDRYLAAPYPFHLQRDAAALLHRVSDSVERFVHLLLASGVAALSEVLVVVGIVAVLVAASPLSALLAVAALALLLGVVLWLLQRRAFALGEQQNELRKSVLRTVRETLDGIKEIHAMDRADFYRRRFAGEQQRLARVSQHHHLLEFSPRLVIETLFIVATLAVVLLLTGEGRGPISEMVPLLGLYAYAGFRVIPSFNRILMHANNIWFALPAADELAEDLEGLREGPEEPLRPAADSSLTFRDKIAFEGVSYTYDSRGQPALRSVDLEIPQGSSVALVGASGAGKSTLVDLLLGLLTPTAGAITVDGIDVRRALAAWRRKIGYVPQMIYLTDDTLRSNVAFGQTAEDVDEERLARALEMARLGELVDSLPHGLETPVGDRGVQLSGGQRQRVAIARALYRDPELLIFDEATSALDGRAERELAEVLRSLRGHKTLLVVAHRLSTIRSCERLVFLRHGAVEAVGSYEELARESPAFRRTVGLPSP